MTTKAQEFAKRFLAREWEKLSARERKVIESLINGSHVSRNINRDIDDDRTFGERAADAIAKFGGSWTFMFIFAGILISWVNLEFVYSGKSK